MLVEFVANWLTFVALVFFWDWNFGEMVVLAAGWRWRRRIAESKVLNQLSQIHRTLSARPWASVFAAAAIAPLLRVAALAIYGVPAPVIPDEFSHLLVADTLSHGRLTNPTHPLWVHFETIHEIHLPTYNSMYFPGQGAILAVGQILGHPWIGVLLSVALLCGATVWALQAWMPNRWALVGGLLVVARIGLNSYWVNSYWGGALASFGGCLIVGAFGRLRTKFSFTQGVLLGLGAGILASIRPFEGFIFCLAVGASVLYLIAKRKNWISALTRVAIPSLAAAALILGCVGYYFYKVTGDPLKPPYLINSQQYGWPLTLPWTKAVKKEYRHPELGYYFDWEKQEHDKKESPLAIFLNAPIVLARFWTFFFGPTLTLVLYWTRRRWNVRRISPLVLWLIPTFFICMIEAAYPHYYAPATICLIALSLQGLRVLRASDRATREGLVRYRFALVTLCAISLILLATPPKRMTAARKRSLYLSWCCIADAGRERANILGYMTSQPGKHVIFAAYTHGEYLTDEWVYNSADIDSQKVIWARDMGPEKNRELLEYYQDRKFWVVRPNEDKPWPQPYPVDRGKRPSNDLGLGDR